ncbi:bifunctional heptose 7-phosphate kinase/heptose 1-phosphate adenyltransferase [Candidatus Pacearchaeota archaeon]|nr:bifunctional heptose 7-phosphate kinase/heptose 1-phosphate adenyltransferase [Candidatus Pacearchaeota archaeon]
MNGFDKIMSSFENKKILVIGDLILDKYVYGNISRISPEAPVPILNVTDETYDLGGSGNVASNIVSLKGNVTLFAFVGKDNHAEILKKLCKEKNINCSLDENHSTITKSRICCKNQQIIRMDQEDINEKFFSKETKKKILSEAEKSDIIIVSDYLKGTITKDLVDLIFPFKSKTIVDTKPKHIHLFKGFFLIKPNEKEAKEMTGLSDIKEAGKKLMDELDSNILITIGEKGMLIFSKENLVEIPTFAREVYDVSGAGDTVIATLSLAISSKASLEEAAIIANYAAGIAVEKKGTYSVLLSELRSRIASKERKIVELEELKKLVHDYKIKNKKIVWTNGCFDILHIGHLKYLKEAKKLGDILIVGIDSDDSIRRLKGPERPINTELDRAEILAGMGFIDYVIIYPYQGVKDYLAILKPDFYVKGGDYNINTINQEERKVVESYNGKIILGINVPNKSTTNTIKKIKENNEK